MARSIILAALLVCVPAARMQRKRANHVGRVPVFGTATPTSNRFLVYFKPDATDAMLDEFCAENCLFKGHPEAGGIPFVVMSSETAMIRSVSAHEASLQMVEYDGDMEDDKSADSSTGTTWGLDRIGSSQRSGTGAGVNIYVLDSGVRVTHQDFAPARAIPTLNALELPPKECAADDADCVYDNRGHGSHVAGSAAGTQYGVAPGATIRAMNRGRSYADAFASMDWVALNNIKPAVLTMSFGSGGQAAGSEVAVDAVVNQGVTVTVSAGNNDYDACQKTFAFIPSAIVVGSSDSLDSRSYFSNFGQCVTLFAPGSSIPSADHLSDGGESIKSGTSMATPHVAGGVALILQSEPSLNPAKVRQRLIENAETNSLADVQGSPNLLLNIAA